MGETWRKEGEQRQGRRRGPPDLISMFSSSLSSCRSDFSWLSCCCSRWLSSSRVSFLLSSCRD